MWAIGEPSGPIEKGTTYIVRPVHAALEEAVERLAHLGRVAPVVGRAGVGLVLGADEGAVFDPGDVGGVGEGEVGVRALGVGEALEGARVDQRLGEGVVLLGRAVAPVDGVGLGQVGDLPDPVEELCVRGRRFGRDGLAHSRHFIHWPLDDPLTSASLLRIFSVAVFFLALRLHPAVERLPFSTFWSDGQSTEETFFFSELEVGFQLFLGLGSSITVSPQPTARSYP